MKSNYKKLGQYIQLVDERNKNLEITNLQGISINKTFIPSIANTIGTNFANYKIVRTGQFAYGPVTSRNGDKISIALLKNEDCIISSSYISFEIINQNELLPEYLMLWFMRTEFDRYARFMSHGSAREVFDWNCMCDVELPVPSMEEQIKIVHDYNVVTDRIELLKNINNNLIEMISTLFLELYSNLKNESEVQLDEICTLSSSKRVFADEYTSYGIPFYRGKEITLKQAGQPIIDPLYIEKSYFEELKSKYGIPTLGDVLITAVGTIGNSYLVQNEEFYFKDGNIIWLKNFSNRLNYYIYDFMQTPIFKEIIEGICIGSNQTALTIADLSKIKVKLADNNTIKKYTIHSKAIHNQIEKNSQEISYMYDLQLALLSRLSS